MAVLGITIRTVQSLTPGQTIWDAGHRKAVRGFGVRRQRGAAVYVVKYRALGRQRFLTIGPHGSPWTPEKARKEAKRLLGLVAGGKDPADERSLSGASGYRNIPQNCRSIFEAGQTTPTNRTYYETERYLLSAWKASSFHARVPHPTTPYRRSHGRDCGWSRNCNSGPGARSFVGDVGLGNPRRARHCGQPSSRHRPAGRTKGARAGFD